MMKQDTIEEAAIIRYGSDQYLWAKQRDGFVEGAKWQQEQDKKEIQDLKDRLDTVRHINTTFIKAVEKLKKQYDSMYSEDEVFNLLMEFSSRDINSSSGTPYNIAKWFEKFKKK